MTFDKENMNKKILPPIIAAAVTLVVYYATKNLWHLWAAGPALMIFFACWSLQVAMADKWLFNRLGILPCLIGIFTSLLGQWSLFSALSHAMSGDEGPPYSAMVATAISSISSSLEVLLLGAGLSLALYTVCACIAAYQTKQ